MEAVIMSGGKQYRVREGDVVRLERLPAGQGDTVTFAVTEPGAYYLFVDSHEGGASQSRPTSAKTGPCRVFQTSNFSGVDRPRTGMSTGVTSAPTHCPFAITR